MKYLLYDLWTNIKKVSVSVYFPVCADSNNEHDSLHRTCKLLLDKRGKSGSAGSMGR